MKAFITFYGGKGGQQSVRRQVEVLHLADGSHRFRLDLNDIPVRASYAEVEVEDEYQFSGTLNIDTIDHRFPRYPGVNSSDVNVKVPGLIGSGV